MPNFANGVISHLGINWLTLTKMREALVLGERGMFRVDDLTRDLYFFENAETEGDLWRACRTARNRLNWNCRCFWMPW